MAVSVVIPTRDRPQDLLDAVNSILAGTRLPDELIVADQSTGTRACLPTGAGVEVVHLPLRSVGVSRARNAAIAAARHDVLVFMDDDVLVAADWLERLVEALRAAPPRTAVTGAVLPATTAGGHVPSVTHRTEPEVFAGRPFADPLFSNNMALPRAAFVEVGLFDERFGAGANFSNAEDNDLGYRLLEAGYRIAFVPTAVLYHRGVRRGRALAELDWSYGRGQGAFYAKHMSRADPHMRRRLRRNVAYRVRRMAPALRGERSALREGIYLAGLLTGVAGWWRRHGRAGDGHDVPRLAA